MVAFFHHERNVGEELALTEGFGESVCFQNVVAAFRRFRKGKTDVSGCVFGRVYLIHMLDLLFLAGDRDIVVLLSEVDLCLDDALDACDLLLLKVVKLLLTLARF